MPIHPRRTTRREFLERSLAAGAALALARHLGCTTTATVPATAPATAPPVDPNRFVLLADVHISAKAAEKVGTVNLTDCLVQTVGEVVRLAPRPAAVIVCGDCARLKGLEGDYRQLGALLAPLRGADIPVHLLVGNHDRRDNLYAMLPDQQLEAPAIEGRHACVLQTPRVNWFLLDSLDKTNDVPGELGPQQIAWLAEALDARADKPAIVMAHHDLQFADDLEALKKKNKKPGGLRDTQALFDVLAKRRHVAAYLFGHDHRWQRRDRDGLPLVGLPGAAYTFDKAQPSAYVLADVKEGGATLELRCLDAKHKLHGEKVELPWRA
jgi:3',5'-cyclic AMP phosphodiesterase CpdA